MTLELIITTHCNLNCGYCYYKGISKQVMTFETAKRAIDLLCMTAIDKKDPKLYISFFGGEPLLNKELIYKCVEYANTNYKNKINIGYALATNGTLLDDDFISFIKKEMFIVHISIDGTETVHNTNRPAKDGQNSFRMTEQSIDKLPRDYLYVATVITVKSLEYIVESIDYLLSKNINKIILTVDYGDNWDADLFNKLKKTYKMLLNKYKSLNKNSKKTTITLFDDKINLIETGCSYKKYCCNLGRDIFVIAPNGDIFPCTRFADRSKGMDYSTGNIFCGMNKENLQIVENARDKDKKECVNCDIKDICLGNSCSCISYSSTGTISGILPFICEHERMLVKLIYESKLINS